MCGMRPEGAAGAEVVRMRSVRFGRRKMGWMTAVAVALAVIGHAVLMAGGGHPTAAAAHPVPASGIVASPASTSHHAASAPATPRASHAMHGDARSSAVAEVVSNLDAATASEHSPAGDEPAGDRSAGCNGLLALAWPQPQPAPSASSAPLLSSPTVDLAVLPETTYRVSADRLDPTAPPGTRRALLQIYRL